LIIEARKDFNGLSYVSYHVSFDGNPSWCRTLGYIAYLLSYAQTVYFQNNLEGDSAGKNSRIANNGQDYDPLGPADE